MSKKLAWGLIGTGGIARAFASALTHSHTGELVAIGSRSMEKAEAFAAEFPAPHRHGSYEALLANPAVEAVYISTPHPNHAEWAIAAAKAGKHILCEKPIGLNAAEAQQIIDAAKRHDVFLMEAFMYRCHPQIAKLIELLRGGAIGEVRVIQATFSFHSPFNPDSRIYKNALGGGGILDVGCYCTSMARLVAGIANGMDFIEPLEVKGTGVLGKTGVDEYAVASLKFPGGVLAELATGVAVGQESVVRIFGSEGSIMLPTPWIPTREGGTTKIIVQQKGSHEPQEILVETDEWLYAMEADIVARHLADRQAPSPAMSWADTLGNMQTLDRWRAEIGLVYDAEK
ncbi:MAG: Gfo/Idh/MocA family protein [Armatimonadota bacterium]